LSEEALQETVREVCVEELAVRPPGVDGACVSTALDGTCVAGTINGRIDLTLTAKKGQSITLYVRNYDAARGGTLHGKVTVTVGGPEVLLGTITLR